MTRDDIIAMAREAGFDVEAIEGTEEVLERGADSDYYTRHPNIGYMVQTHTVERFAALVAAHEREMCAGLCQWKTGVRPVDAAIETCAAAIRARGETK